tara:strand:+ start:1943 stop:2200 length:258 start_codon:yes stop_codon:yes gene_type:complete
MDLAQLIADFGFPIVATVGLLYMIYFIWNHITKQIKAKLNEANVTLIALIDRIRMLDNDMLRLQQKLDTVLQLRENEKKEKTNSK